MGWAKCRFDSCSETGSKEYHINLNDLNISLNVPSMWKHYMVYHLVQPTEREREVIMAANPEAASGRLITHRLIFELVQIMYVEKEAEGYSHKVGTKPDTEFIEKLETILNGIEPLQTKGFGRKDYR